MHGNSRHLPTIPSCRYLGTVMFRSFVFPICLCLVLATISVCDGQEPTMAKVHSPAPTMTQSADPVVTQEYLIDDGIGSGNCGSVNCGCSGATAGRSRCSCLRNKFSVKAIQQRSQGPLETMAKTLNVREMPSGTQGMNMPYHTPQLYHYKRPYNTLHVRAARQQYEDEAIGAPENRAHVYSTEVFDEIHQQLAPMHRRSTDLGYLEYSDWRKYEAARQEWEFHRPGKVDGRASTPANSAPLETATPPLPSDVSSRKTRALLGSTTTRSAK